MVGSRRKAGMALALEQEVDIHKLAEVALLVEMVGMVEVHTHS